MKKVIQITYEEAELLKGEAYYVDKRGVELFFNPQEDEDGDYFISKHEKDTYLEIDDKVKEKKFSWLFDAKEKDHKPKKVEDGLSDKSK